MNDSAFNPAYIERRLDVERLLPKETRSILDIGCSNGTAGRAMKDVTGARVVGIELVPAMAEVARTKLDEVHVGDVQSILEGDFLVGQRFDVIVLADVLEHVADPWQVLRLAREFLSDTGAVIASIPNVRHIDTIYNLMFKGRWPYRDRGIHDRSHLRFFTRSNIEELMATAHLTIDAEIANYRIIERPHSWNRFAHRLAMIPGLKPFLAFQYVTRARPSLKPT